MFIVYLRSSPEKTRNLPNDGRVPVCVAAPVAVAAQLQVAFHLKFEIERAAQEELQRAPKMVYTSRVRPSGRQGFSFLFPPIPRRATPPATG